MKITIHRSANQNGGGITEIESNDYKVFIDFGEQLPGDEIADTDLSAIERLICGDASKAHYL